MAALGSHTITTGPSLSGTWKLLWTTEKEQLFIIDNAHWFGTEAGDVLQVIDVENRVLNNVITFPPHGVFFVRSGIEVASPQRVNFRCEFVGSCFVSIVSCWCAIVLFDYLLGFGRFTSAVLRGENWEFPLPPFGQGWLV